MGQTILSEESLKVIFCLHSPKNVDQPCFQYDMGEKRSQLLDCDTHVFPPVSLI